MHVHWPQLTHPDDVAADVAQFEKVVAGGLDGYVIEKRLIRKDGRAIWCTMAAQCVRAADGSVDFFVALVQDMTEPREISHALEDQVSRLIGAGIELEQSAAGPPS